MVLIDGPHLIPFNTIPPPSSPLFIFKELFIWKYAFSVVVGIALYIYQCLKTCLFVCLIAIQILINEQTHQGKEAL
jgi:hypothetical protein